MKKNKTKFLMIVFAILLLVPGVAFAYELKLEEETVLVPKDQIIEDDLIVTGESVTIDGTVNGDLIAFAANITINGDINGNVIVAGSNVRVNGLIFGDLKMAGGMVELEGEVTDDLMAAGGTMSIDGEVRDNAMIAGGMIDFSERGKIGRDLLIGGGMINLAGDINRNVTFGAGKITVLGKIGGDLSGEADDKVAIESTAEIDGNVNYNAPSEAEIKEGAEIIGEKEWSKIEEKIAEGKSFFSKVIAKIYGGLALLMVAIVAMLLFPNKSKEVVNNLNEKPAKSILYGLILTVITPILIVILAITILGIPLAIILGLVYGVLIYSSKIYAGLWVGSRLLGYVSSNKKDNNLVWSVVLGIVVLWALFLIPFLGGLIKVVATLFGLGAIMICIFTYYKQKKSNKVSNKNKKAPKTSKKK